MNIRNALEWLGWVTHEASAVHPWLSWILHGVMALPLVGAALALPDWTTPGLVFAYRELEQMWHRWFRGVPLDWIDHIFDVAVPLAVGWWLLA